jgi:WD40 repeat protein
LLDALTGRETPFTVLIDALDEAADPDGLTRQLLRPLADHADGRLRLLVGTRPHLLAGLGLRREDSIDLDAAHYADLDALTTYTARGLLDSVPHSPYRQQEPGTIRDIARAVARASTPSFLVARITSSTLAAEPVVPDPGDPSWRAMLPRLPGDAMRHDLETRLGDNADRVRDLLRPLAYAEGQGLPWEDIWAALASHLAGISYTDDDLLWLRRHAGSYVVEATEAGRSAYRLYHLAMAEHFRDGVDDTLVHNAFTHVLRSRVPVDPDGARDWSRAHPYALRHLASHAAHCGLLDELIADAGYLVHAEPEQLLPALHGATTDDGRVTASIYRASAALHHRLDPMRRRQVLATDAARFAATRQHRALAETLPWPPRWATGYQTNPALRAAFDSQMMNAVHALACAEVDGQPVVVTGGAVGVGGIGHPVWVWDLVTGTLRAILTGHESVVDTVACTTVDGRPVAVSGSRDNTVRVWDLDTGAPLATLTGHNGSVDEVACATVDGRGMAVTTSNSDGTARLWDLAAGTQRAILIDDARWASMLCTTVDDQPVAVTGGADAIWVWDLRTGALRTTLAVGEGRTAMLVSTTVDGRAVVVSRGSGNTLCVWDLGTGDLHATLTGHEYSVRAVACTTVDGRPVAVTGGIDRVVRVWDLMSGTPLATLAGHDSAVYAVDCAVIDGQPVAVSAGIGGTVRLWDLAAAIGGQPVTGGHTGDIFAMASCVVDGRPVAVTASDDKTVRVWDLATGSLRTTLTGHRSPVLGVACAVVDSRPVAVTVDNWTVLVWDLGTGTLHSTLADQERAVYAVACTVVDGRPVAVTGSGSTVRVWDLSTGTLRATFTGHEDMVGAVACTVVDGRPVAVTVSYDDGSMRVWDLDTGASRAIRIDHQGFVTALACGIADGRPVAVTTSEDQTARVWDLDTGTLRATLTGHRDHVNAVACGVVDGRPVAVTGSEDGTVRLWDLTTAAQLAVFDFAGYLRGALCFGPAQEILVGAGWDVVAIDTRSTRRSPRGRPA